MSREVTTHTLSQNDKIHKYLKDHEYISQYEATLLFGCYRLPARISDLKKMRNLNIKTTMVTTKNEDGNTVNYARYSLVKEN